MSRHAVALQSRNEGVVHSTITNTLVAEDWQTGTVLVRTSTTAAAKRNGAEVGLSLTTSFAVV